MKLLTHNYCDNCGFTKKKVFVTELFWEAGFIQCEDCINKLKQNIMMKNKWQLTSINQGYQMTKIIKGYISCRPLTWFEKVKYWRKIKRKA